MIKVLFINSIFPNPVEPNKGNFVLKNIAAFPNEVDVIVIAPVPLFLSSWRGNRAVRIPNKEVISLGARQITVLRPRFIVVPRNILQSLIPLLEYLMLRTTVNRLIKQWKPDIIHANFGTPDGIAAALISRETGIPLVITEHQAKLRDFLNKKLIGKQMLFAYHTAMRVICVSSFSAGIIKDFCNTLSNIVVIPNGVDFSRFSLRLAGTSPQKAIYVGYLIKHKGVHILLHAMAVLMHRGMKLELSIVGDGNEKDNLKALCRSLGIDNHVKFHGEKKADKVASLMSQHDFMIHPSFIESFGIVMVEALAAGLPVLSTYNGGAEDIITDEIGILVKPNDVEALAEGIITMMNKWASYNPAILRKIAEDRFSMDNVANRTIMLYKECLDAKR